MSQDYYPLLIGFIGVVIGSLSSVITIFIQSYYQHKREITKIATEAAIENFKLLVDNAHKENKKTTIPPLSLFIHYQVELMRLIDKRKLTPETFKKLNADSERYELYVKK